MEKYIILRDLNETTDTILNDLTRQTQDILQGLGGRRAMTNGGAGMGW